MKLVDRRNRLALGERLKDRRRLQTDRGIGGHQGQVGVEPGGFFVVVARAHLREIRRSPVFAAGDKTELAVHLIAVPPVNDLTPGLLQTARPFDVVFLVKARLQLDQHEHAFAVFGRFDEGFDDLAVPRDPVQGHLDRHNGGIVRRLL